jgi:hypothetical protein
MTLGIGKQRELPRRPGDWKSAQGDMNAVPESAGAEAEEMARRHTKTPPSAKPQDQATEAPKGHE